MANFKDSVKKILREPLFYLLPALIVIFLIVISSSPKISDVQLTKNGTTENIKFPYWVNDMPRNEVFIVTFKLFTKSEFVKFNIIPDDCIREILINEQSFPLDGIRGICDTQKGANFNFSEYIQKGSNTFSLRLDNSGGGPAGVDVKTSLKQFTIMHCILALLLMSSFSLMLWKFRNNETVFKSVLLFIATTIFWFIGNGASRTPEIIPAESLMFLTFIFLGASLIFLFNKRVNYTTFIFILAVFVAFILIRGGLLYFKSIDYNNFLSPWLNQMRPLSIRDALVTKIGDYNMPYLYVLMLISRLQINDLFLIKFVSIAFDIMLAYYVMRIVSIKFENINIQITAFIAALAIPTVILNAAFWAQCDVIYAALAIASLYYGFTNKSIRAFIFFGLAFSVKLQTIFIAPMMLVFLFKKKIKVVHLWVPVVTFLITLVPALIAGRSFMETISIYYEQTNSYPQMVLNTPNIYALLGNVKFENFNFIAIFITGIAVMCLIYFLYLNREKIISTSDYVSIAFVFVLVIPMLLPRMHERYFFLADVLSVVLVFFNKKRWYFAPIIILGSFMTYSRFLLGRNYIVPMEYASLIMIFITFVAVKDLIERFLLNNPTVCETNKQFYYEQHGE